MTTVNENDYVNKLKEDYQGRPVTKMDELRNLDKRVKRPAKIFSYTFGAVSSLILGTGMCLAMGVIGTALSFAMPLGIVIGVVGIAMACANYFIYKAILASRKRKYADKILSLSEEIINN